MHNHRLIIGMKDNRASCQTLIDHIHQSRNDCLVIAVNVTLVAEHKHLLIAELVRSVGKTSCIKEKTLANMATIKTTAVSVARKKRDSLLTHRTLLRGWHQDSSFFVR